MVIRRPVVAACATLLLAGLASPAHAQSPTTPSSAPSAGSSPETPASAGDPVSWRTTPTGSTDEFRGLAAVSSKVAWVSGETGTVLRTVNGGGTWQNVSPPAAAGFALRDIEAFDAQHAVTLSIGKGKHSQIFATNNGGQTWSRTFMNHNGNAFFDCMAFAADGTGLALSDPVDGRFRLVVSHDRGQSWRLLIPFHMPKALDGEFAFAASGTCLIAGPRHQFWIASGGSHPRVFHTYDDGQYWTVAPTPVRGGATAGIYSIAIHGAGHMVAVGGDYTKPGAGARAAATSYDWGTTWIRSGRPLAGYRSGVAYVLPKLVVAVGPTGSDLSRSGGVRWYHFDDASLDSIECAHDGGCWGSGSAGLVRVLVH